MLLGRRGSKRTLPCGSQFLARIQEESEVLPEAKTNLLRKEQKGHLKEEVGKAKKGTGAGMMRYGVFTRQGFVYSSSPSWADNFDQY